MSFQEKRRKELGLVNDNNKRSFQEKRKMQLGMIPSDLSVEETIPKTKDFGPRPSYQNTTPTLEQPTQQEPYNPDGFLGVGDLSQYKNNVPTPQPTNATNTNEGRGGFLGFLDSTVGRASKSFADSYFPGVIDAQNEVMTKRGSDNPIAKEVSSSPDSFLEKGADISGTFGAYAAPSVAAYKAVNATTKLKPIQKLATKLGNKGTKGKVGLEASKGIGAGGVLGAGEALRDETFVPDKYDLKDHLQRAGINMAAGAVLDPALVVGAPAAIKGGIKAFKERGLNKEIKAFAKRTEEALPFDPLKRTTKAENKASDAPRLSTLDSPVTRGLEPPPKGLGDDILGKSEMPSLPSKNASPLNVIKGKNELPKAKQDINLLDGINVQPLKDHSGFKFNTTDLYRNFRDVFGKQFPQIKKAVLEPFDASKKEFVEMQENLAKELKREVVDKLGIGKKTKLSKLVQDYGEKTISLDELKKKAPNDWENVVKADQWFRKTYDDILDKINASRAQIYPNNPSKLIPKRSDYYRHFREFEGLAGLKNLFDTPSEIDPSLVGISEFTKPRSKFAGFMQKRGLGPYKSDAVGGFLEYMPGASYATHIDPHIDVFKNLSKEIKEQTQTDRNLNNFINYLEKYSQDLAGKTNAADRYFQENIPGGRMTMASINWLNNRVKANVILGNVASSLSQLANIPNGVAFAKQYSVPGAGKTLRSIFETNKDMKKSGFMKERFSGKIYRQFDTKWLSLDNPLMTKRAASWMIETADRIGTTFIWNSAHAKAVAEGIENPIKYADDMTRNLVAGRGIGEVPLLQKSKLFQMVAPFQLEVANVWRVQKDFVNEKDLAALATFYLGSYMFNKGMEEIRGSGVVFDPIQSIVDASQEGLTPLERGGRLAGEVLSNVPLGQSLASVYPEYGGEVLGKRLPTREKLFGDNDPTRFGTGLPVVKGLQDPKYYALPSFGGNQLRKTLQGREALSKEGDFVNDKLKFPVEKNTANSSKALLFGPSATDEGKEYYKKDRRPLSERQTEAYINSKDPQKYYDHLMDDRLVSKYKRQINEIKKNKDMGIDEKKKEIDKVIKKLKEIIPKD